MKTIPWPPSLTKAMADAEDVEMTPVVDERKVGDPNPPEIKAAGVWGARV